uniref:Phospho-N-acetylmuramoyl-pentapeptide-transferase n=1 Tax=Lygus hesperus TaxID=30085 RepID=A0A0A9WRZ2_LYGHE
MAFSRLSIIKLVEAILAAVILYMHYETYEANGQSELFLITTTFGGFLIITVGTFLGHISGNGLNRIVDMYFCVLGACLYIAAGSMSINHFQGWKFSSSTSNMGLTKGSLGIIQGAILLVDAFFVYKA